MAKTIVGLDIGHGVLRAAEIANPGRPRPTLVRYQELAVPIEALNRGEVVDRDIVSRALRVLWSRARFGTKDVVLGVGNQRVLSRDHTVREAPLNRIREALPFQVQDLLPVPIGDALLDFYPVSRHMSDEGPMIHGLLVAAIKDAVLGNVEAVEAAGLHVAEVDLIPFALTRLLAGAAAPGVVSALVAIGASTTSVVISVGGVPNFVRVLPSGSREINDAIVARHGIAFEDAEQMKRSIGVAPVALAPEHRPLVETMHAATGELLSSVRNTMAYFAAQRPDLPIQQLILSGGGADMPGIREAMTELTRVPVAAIDPFAHMTVGRAVSADIVKQARTNASVAIGLAVGSNA
jgi:type IV pilus assembly protein PilM